MIKIYRYIYIGDDEDYNKMKNNKDFFFINAAKEPYHRKALGYKGVSCGKNHPNYLSVWLKDENRLILNLVDAKSANYIPKELIEKTLDVLHEQVRLKQNILINCNKGESRSATIGLLYLKKYTKQFKDMTYDEAKIKYKEEDYPPFNPGVGMDDFARKYWEEL